MNKIEIIVALLAADLRSGTYVDGSDVVRFARLADQIIEEGRK